MTKQRTRRRLSDSFLLEFNRLNPILFSDPNLILCKIGKKEHLEQLQQGIIYARPLGAFCDLYDSEMSHQQVDIFEGCIHVADEADIVVQGVLVGKAYGLKEQIGQKTPVFCCMLPRLSQVDLDEWRVYFDSRLFKDFVHGEMCNYGVLLIDGIKFKERLECLGIECYGKRISYTDKPFDRTRSNLVEAIFRKRLSFAYQQEFRVVFYKESKEKGEVLKQNVGSLRDFSRLFPISIVRSPLIVKKSLLSERKLNFPS